WKTAKILKLLPQLGLTVGREAVERGIALERFLLLVWWKSLVFLQLVAGMTCLLSLSVRRVTRALLVGGWILRGADRHTKPYRQRHNGEPPASRAPPGNQHASP